jgi:hypothetical protein
MVETPVPAALTAAIAALWRIRPPGPGNILSDRRFIRLRDACDSLYSIDRTARAPGFALSNAMRALGLPCGLKPANAHLALPAKTAARQMDEAFRRTLAMRVYLCPLDMSDDLPLLKFGPNRICKFTAAELEALVNPSRLKRMNANWTFDAKRFSEFSWLMVKEGYPLDREPEARVMPWWFESSKDLNSDWGRIEPHKEQFPTAVEGALFAVLLAPWEDWVEMPEDHWCGFRVPWVYTLSDDIFVRPEAPYSPDTLSWRPYAYFDAEENVEFETEVPERIELKAAAAVEAPNLLNDKVWSELVTAHQSLLFETPIAHFLVRAFLADGVDEFLAHITTIEAALGLQSDYGGKFPSQVAKRRTLGATARMAARVSALLGAKSDGDAYCRLFNLRSAYLHGRTMNAITGEERIVARRLARRVVNELIGAALAEPAGRSREDYLNDLLDRGLGLS